MYRCPQTTGEKREDQTEYVRAKRNRANLADAWDDICRSDWRDRSWKRYRRTQYKVVSHAESD